MMRIRRCRLLVVGVVVAVVVVKAAAASSTVEAAFCCHRSSSASATDGFTNTDGADRFFHATPSSSLQLGSGAGRCYSKKANDGRRLTDHASSAPLTDHHQHHENEAVVGKAVVDDGGGGGQGTRRRVIFGAGCCWSAAAFLGAAPASSAAPSFAAESALPTAQSGVDDDGVAPQNDAFDVNESITIPLRYSARLSAYLLQYGVGANRFAAIMDTGSPFLVIPGGYCAPGDEQGNGKNAETRTPPLTTTTTTTTRTRNGRYGCYEPQQSRPSGLASTFERFDNNQGEVEWRVAPFSFVDVAPGSRMIGPREMVFGVLSESLIEGLGGVFFGLVRDTDSWIRPSFLSQTNVNRMVIDLRGIPGQSGNKTLTLYNTNRGIAPGSLKMRREEPQQRPLPGNRYSYIPLTRELNRKYGDVVIHYTAQAAAFTVNDHSVLQGSNKSRKRRPIYVIFDTGVTGMVVSQELFDQRYLDARQRREKSLWGDVTVTFASKPLSNSGLDDDDNTSSNTNKKKEVDATGESTKSVSLSAHKPVTTPLGTTWPKFKNAYLIVLGLAFLDGHRIEIDMDHDRLQLT